MWYSSKFKDIILQLAFFTTPYFKSQVCILSPFNKAVSNIMAMNYVMATSDAIVPDMDKKSAEFGVDLISAEKFLMGKAHQTH
jgi:hypothetical protein